MNVPHDTGASAGSVESPGDLLPYSEIEQACETFRVFVEAARRPRSLLEFVRLRHQDLRTLVTMVRSLPSISVSTSDSAAGRYLSARISRNFEEGPHGAHRVLLRIAKRLVIGRASAVAVGVLPIPVDPDDYLKGSRRQRVRTSLRRAADSGITCSEVTDPAQQALRLQWILDERFDDWHDKELAIGRRLINEGLARIFCSEGDEGDILAVALVVTDGDWSCMHLCVSVSGKRSSPARYLLHARLVEELARSEVRHLMVSDSILELSPGIRVFQRIIGFEPVNLRLDRPR